MCLRAIPAQMASLGWWTLPFCSLARMSPTFCTVASIPIESTPHLFLGWYLNGVGPLPPPAVTTATAQQQGSPVGRRARDIWTATLDYVRRCTSVQCSSRFRTARTITHETRGRACLSRTLPVAMQPREGADPSLTNTTCSLRAPPACRNCASLALRI